MLNHFDENNNAIMVDVSEKTHNERVALACGTIQVSAEVMDAIASHSIQKGDVLGVARIAGIMAAKKTHELVPMCHLLMLTNCTIDFKCDVKKNEITAYCQVKTVGPTGVEMEALCGVQIALLTIYDMCKAMDKSMRMKDIHLMTKKGGKSGDFQWKEE